MEMSGSMTGIGPGSVPIQYLQNKRNFGPVLTAAYACAKEPHR
jgi:hypothetical protein